jgi:hypothetical protein
VGIEKVYGRSGKGDTRHRPTEKKRNQGRDKKIYGVLTHSMAGNEQIEVELDSGGDRTNSTRTRMA